MYGSQVRSLYRPPFRRKDADGPKRNKHRIPERGPVPSLAFDISTTTANDDRPRLAPEGRMGLFYF